MRFWLNEAAEQASGNKRIGAHAMLVFLAINGTELIYTQEELSSIILAVASGGKMYEDLLGWLIDHQQE